MAEIRESAILGASGANELFAIQRFTCSACALGQAQASLGVALCPVTRVKPLNTRIVSVAGLWMYSHSSSQYVWEMRRGD